MRYGLFLMILCVLAVACAPSHAGLSSQTLRIGIGPEPNTLNPLFSGLPEEILIDNLIFDPLLASDVQGRAVPVLASQVPTVENGGISRDGLTIIYHLRNEPRWQDGVPVTSRDVVFSFNAVMNPKNNVALRDGYNQIKSVTASDAHTVVVHLKRRYAAVLSTFFGQGQLGYVLPEHVLSRYDSLNKVDFNSHPVGDGAFRFVSWRRGDSIELAANAQYYRGRPKVQQIIIRFIPDDNTRVLQLRSHDIDVLWGASPNVYPRLLALQNDGFETLRLTAMGWNGIAFNVQHAPLGDSRVRRALAMAIDKRALLHNVLYDAQASADEDIPRYSWAYANGIELPRYDPAAARRLLVYAGYGNKPIHLVMAFDAGSAAARSAAVQVQAALAKIGVEVELKGYPGSAFFAPGTGGILEGGHFDLAYDLFINHSGEPDNSTWVTCAQIDPAGINDARYCNPEVDRLEDLALNTYDRYKRRLAYAQIESALARDVPYIVISGQNIIVAADRRFHGLTSNLDLSIANAQEWSL